jgi:hypothetical protein
MGADKPVEDPTARADFQKVIRHFVTTPHKPHSPLVTTPQTKRAVATQRQKSGRVRKTLESQNERTFEPEKGKPAK